MADTVVTPEVVAPVEPQVEKTVPYDRFSAVNSEKNALAAQLADMKAKIEAEKTAAETKRAKDEGDYATLMQKVQQEREQERAKLNNMVTSTFLNTLATKNELLKDEYIKLFTEQVEVDNLEIKNSAKVEEAFIKFKLDNPTLFKPMPAVPKTDSTPVKKIDNTLDPTKLSQQERFDLGLKEFRNKQ